MQRTNNRRGADWCFALDGQDRSYYQILLLSQALNTLLDELRRWTESNRRLLGHFGNQSIVAQGLLQFLSLFS